MTTTRKPPRPAVDRTARQQFVLERMGGPGSVYVHGPPGSGKTMLLDAAHATRARSVRWHCAEFFRAVHAELPRHRRSVEATIAALTGRARAVFFDEFHLHDVADAIYLDRALAWWAAHRVRVVATSNYPPDELLPNPLLHHAAEPVIERIIASFEVLELDEGVDHRRYTPAAEKGFASGVWLPLVAHAPVSADVRVGGRQLAVVEPGPGATSGPGGSRVLETTFAVLCRSPWSTSDYLALLAEYGSVVVHDVPDPAHLGREPGQRLANLVDVAYDDDVPLTIHSDGSPERLLDADFPPLDAARTVSRLTAMCAPGV